MSPDLDLAARLQSAIHRVFPDRSQPRVVDLTRITDGWECDVFSFVLESRGGALTSREALILRVYQGQGAPRKAVAEFDVLRRLRAVGYPVPEVHALVVDNSPLDRPFVIMEKVDGPTLGTSMETTSGDARDALLRRFCKLVVELHALDWREIVPNASPAKATDPINSWTVGAEALGMRPGAAARMLDELNHLLTARTVLLEQTGLTIPGVEALLASPGG